jgi:hypothetical protein
VKARPLPRAVNAMREIRPMLEDATAARNLAVLRSLLGPAMRGLLEKSARRSGQSLVDHPQVASFDWRYERSIPELARLYDVAKESQWNAATDLDWSTDVDPTDPNVPLLPEAFHPVSALPLWTRLSPAERADHGHALLAWLLSQFLHGEQGALYAAAQLTEAVPWLDAKLYASTQVYDEGRHVEVFHKYVAEKLERRYDINDNLYIIIDLLVTDPRWDVKFLGMQIMIEGLALGAFGTIRKLTTEPLLRELLKNVITDEARHVHFGVRALERFARTELTDTERREREDLAFEFSVLLRNRFLMHELYDEYYSALMTRREWDRVVAESPLMALYRDTMFRRVVPNLKRIGLLGERVRPRYERLGLLAYENEPAAPDIGAEDLL